MGVQILEASADRVVGTMPVEGNTQPYGLLHGGASAVLAETLGSVGAMLHGGSRQDRRRRGPQLHPPPRASAPAWSPAWPRPVHRGRSTATYEIVITDEAGQARVHRPADLPAA